MDQGDIRFTGRGNEMIGEITGAEYDSFESVCSRPEVIDKIKEIQRRIECRRIGSDSSRVDGDE